MRLLLLKSQVQPKPKTEGPDFSDVEVSYTDPERIMIDEMRTKMGLKTDEELRKEDE